MDTATTALVQENDQLLAPLEEALGTLPESAYRSTPAPHGGSIGQQTRHVLDHYDLLLGHRGGSIDYGRRRRDERTERDPAVAARRLRTVRDHLQRLDAGDHALRVWQETLSDGDRLPLESSLARELAFVASHTVHHLAVIALLADWQGVSLPSTFGVAPSTLNHWARQAATA